MPGTVSGHEHRHIVDTRADRPLSVGRSVAWSTYLHITGFEPVRMSRADRHFQRTRLGTYSGHDSVPSVRSVDVSGTVSGQQCTYSGHEQMRTVNGRDSAQSGSARSGGASTGPPARERQQVTSLSTCTQALPTEQPLVFFSLGHLGEIAVGIHRHG